MSTTNKRILSNLSLYIFKALKIRYGQKAQHLYMLCFHVFFVTCVSPT